MSPNARSVQSLSWAQPSWLDMNLSYQLHITYGDNCHYHNFFCKITFAPPIACLCTHDMHKEDGVGHAGHWKLIESCTQFFWIPSSSSGCNITFYQQYCVLLIFDTVHIREHTTKMNLNQYLQSWRAKLYLNKIDKKYSNSAEQINAQVRTPQETSFKNQNSFDLFILVIQFFILTM